MRGLQLHQRLAGIESGSILNLTAVPKSPYLFSRWSANSSDILFANFTSANTTAIINGAGNITARFSTVAISLSQYSEDLTAGSSISNIANIIGDNQSVTLSITGLPGGATTSWEENQLLDTPIGVKDTLQYIDIIFHAFRYLQRYSYSNLRQR